MHHWQFLSRKARPSLAFEVAVRVLTDACIQVSTPEERDALMQGPGHDGVSGLPSDQMEALCDQVRFHSVSGAPSANFGTALQTLSRR